MILIEETDNRFYIAPSKQPDGGQGVFASVPIKKGDYLEIVGVQVGKESIANTCTTYAKPYKFAAQPGTDFDRHIIPMGYAAIVNHGSDDERNCELREYRGPKRNPNAGRMVYLFIRDVKPDEEILGNYGGNYATVMEWSNEFTKEFEEVKDEWKVFLAFDLYNIGVLQEG